MYCMYIYIYISPNSTHFRQVAWRRLNSLKSRKAARALGRIGGINSLLRRCCETTIHRKAHQLKPWEKKHIENFVPADGACTKNTWEKQSTPHFPLPLGMT